MQPAPPASEQEPPKRSKAAGGIGAVIAAVVAFALKFKALLVVLKVFASSWTFILTLWLYAAAFGWQFGLALVLLILGHELGHYFAFRAYGLPVRLPVFVPFLGAFTAGAIPRTPEQGAYIALAGPLTGFCLAALCYALGTTLHDRFWFACAAFSAFLNLFNMIPFVPFDGGRVVGGLRAAEIGSRIAVGFWYLATAGGLALVTWQSYAGQAAFRLPQ